MKRKFIFFIIYFFSFSLHAQDIDYARKIIDTLTSKNYSGRGAVNGGEKKAANYIASAFKNHGLKYFESSYFQDFNYPINTFYGTLSVLIDTTTLVAGVDFLVAGNSNGINGKFELIWYNKTNVPTKKQLKKLFSRSFFKNKFIVIDDTGVSSENESFQLLWNNLIGAAGIIFLEDKLTKALSNSYQDYVILKIKKGKINRDFKFITIEINQKLIRNYQSQNVIGYVEGTQYPDSFIVLSAHYDHLGMMGNEVYFPGANDNASGVAMLLNLAYHYTHKEPPTKTIVFIAFGAEESGIIGSRYFVENPTVSLSKINFVFNMDLMGTGSEGAMIVNGAIFSKRFELLQKINAENKYLSIIKKRGKAANSDHYWFTEKGVPAFFIYTMGGIKAYHDVDDVSKTLPLTKFEASFRLIRDFVDEL
jgi:hypothetical protein